MTRKKSGFLTFCFSLMPGAGEMYMGFFKQGMSIMTLFFGIMMFGSFINMGEVLMFIPVVWFYSFFHVHNLKTMPDEEFYALEDKIILLSDDQQLKEIITSTKARKVIAVVLIFVGLNSLWSSFTSLLWSILAESIFNVSYIMSVLNQFPRALIAVAFIWVGIMLIRGKKKELEQEVIEG